MSVRWCHLLPEMHSGHQLTCQCPAFKTSDHSAAPVTRPVSILIHTHTHTHTAPVLSNTSVQATAMSKSRTRCQLSVKTCATNFKQMTGQSEESFSLWIRSVQWDSQAETFPHPQVTLWFKRCRHSGTVLISPFGGCLHTHTLFFFPNCAKNADSLEKTPMLGKIKGRRRGWERIRWSDGIPNSMEREWGAGRSGVLQSMESQELDTTWWLNNKRRLNMRSTIITHVRAQFNTELQA